jgi:hypothetical protein
LYQRGRTAPLLPIPGKRLFAGDSSTFGKSCRYDLQKI